MLLRFFLLILCSLSFLIHGFSQDWSLAKDKNGVKVYTRKIEGWGIKEYKVKMLVKASLSKVVATLKDVPGRYNWLHNTIEIREVERPDKDAVCIYNLVDAPWPVSDRDNITQFSFSYPSPKTVRVDMKVIISHKKAPIYNGIVRIRRMKGFWTLTDKGSGHVEVMQQCVAEPGGSIPDWLANSAVVDTPYNSMNNLKKFIEK
jgi:hypothetical protein